MKIKIQFGSSRSTEEEWTKEDYFCPSCGKKEVWSGGGDDYYAGQQHICAACECGFHFYSSPSPAVGRIDDQRVAALKEMTK